MRQQLKIPIHHLLNRRRRAIPKRLADVVDARPEHDERVVAGRLAAQVLVELVDLVVDAGAGVAVNDVLVRRRARHGKVPRQRQRRVQRRRHLAHPVEPAARRRAGQGGVAERAAG